MLIINSITTGGRELLTERYIFPAFRSGTHIRPIETTLRENFSSVLSMRSPNCQRLATMTRDRGRETGSNYSGSDSAQCGCFKAKRPLFYDRVLYALMCEKNSLVFYRAVLYWLYCCAISLFINRCDTDESCNDFILSENTDARCETVSASSRHIPALKVCIGIKQTRNVLVFKCESM